MEYVKLSSILHEVCKKTTINNQYPVLTSSQKGLIEQNLYFNKQVASLNNVGYKVIERGQYTYRSMSDTGLFYINRLTHLDYGIVSPAYPVFELDSNKILPEYLDLYFKSELFQFQIKDFSNGSTRLALKFNKLTTLKINIPTIEEQFKIVNEINKITKIKEKYSKEMFFLENIVKSQFIEMFGDPVENDKNWNREQIQNVIAINKFKGNIELFNGKAWLLNLDMIESNSGKILDYIYESEENIPSSTIKFNNNSVLYSKLRPYLNKVVLPNQSGYATSELISMNPNDLVNKYFLANLLRYESFVKFANGTAYGAKMPRASVDEIKKFHLILPPIELQNKFASFVQQIDKSKYIKSNIYI